VIGAGVDLELGDELTAEHVLREHALHGLLDGQLGLALEQVPVRLFTEAAGLAAVAVVELLVELACP
jgi:hypothetical protein